MIFVNSLYIFDSKHRGTIKLLSLYVTFLRIIPRTWLPLDAAILHCSEIFMLALIVGLLLLGSCAHKRIVNIMNVYIEMNNMQVELIRFRQKYRLLLPLETSKWE